MSFSDVKRAVLYLSALGSFLTPFMGSSVNVALPAIGDEFLMDAVSLSWVATSYLLTAAMFLVPIGRIADIYGRKMVFTWGVVIYTVSSALSATSNSGWTLIAFRFIQGVGGAMIFGTAVAILTSVYPVGERGKALGINVSAVYLGLSLGPFLGGFLTQRFGWRSIFLVNVPLGVVTLIFTLRGLKGEWAEAKGERLDMVGSVILGLTLALIMYGFSLLPTAAGGMLILTGLLGLLTFAVWESSTEYPVLNVNLFRSNATFTFSNLAALINYSATFAVSFLLSLYLQYIKGLSPENAGIILVSQPAVQAALSPFAGKLSDRLEPRLVASSGMAMTVVGLILLMFINEDTTMKYILTSLILLGASFALFSSPNTNAVMSSVDKKIYGVASAILGTMRLTGQMLSMGIATLIFAIYIGRTRITPLEYPMFITSVKMAFTIFAALCLGGVFASLARGKIRKQESLIQ
ncbi:MAG: MFS transporter [Candidatus Bathyarchaeia archaeon]